MEGAAPTDTAGADRFRESKRMVPGTVAECIGESATAMRDPSPSELSVSEKEHSRQNAPGDAIPIRCKLPPALRRTENFMEQHGDPSALWGLEKRLEHLQGGGHGGAGLGGAFRSRHGGDSARCLHVRELLLQPRYDRLSGFIDWREGR
jgi:hypothetical protein